MAGLFNDLIQTGSVETRRSPGLFTQDVWLWTLRAVLSMRRSLVCWCGRRPAKVKEAETGWYGGELSARRPRLRRGRGMDDLRGRVYRWTCKVTFRTPGNSECSRTPAY